MGRLRFFAPATFLLSGCAAPAAYDIDTLGKPASPDQFSADVYFCKTQTMTYTAKPTIGSVAGAGIQGGSDALSYLPINPAIPALGAAGGAGYEAQKGFDLTGQVHRNVFFNCVRSLTDRDRSAVVADPRP